MTLTDFLLARISEDQAVAREGVRWDGGMEIAWRDVGGISESLIIGTARVLAECESKRRIVELHPEHGWSHCEGESLPCPTLRLLALPYADHADYDPSWAA